MTNRRRISMSAMTPAERRVNYPGALPEPEKVAVSTIKSQVDYPTFVNGYAKRMAGFTGLLFTGAASVVGLVMAAPPVWVSYAVGAIGLGLTAAGAVGLLAVYHAHEQWLENGLGVSTRWEHRPPPPEVRETVRPFVASANGTTLNTGRLDFAPTVWQSLLDMALQNGGFVTKEIATKSGVGRRWYHTDPASPDGYRAFLSELRQLRFINERNRITDVVLTWYAAQFPALPLSAIAMRPVPDRPTGDRPGATDRVGEWE